MTARSPKRVSLSGSGTPDLVPDPNGSHDSIVGSPRLRQPGSSGAGSESGVSPISTSLRSRVVSASNVSFNLTTASSSASVSGSRKHVSDVIHGSGSDSPSYLHSRGPSPESGAFATPGVGKRGGGSASIGNLLRGKRTTSASSTSLLGSTTAAAGAGLDSSGPNDYDRNDFREWYAQLMTDVAQHLPFAPTGDTILPDSPNDFVQWSSRTIFGPSLVPISDFLDQASQFHLGESARIASGALQPVSQTSSKPAPVHTTPFSQIKPLDLTDPDCSANAQFIVDVLSSTTAGLPTSGSMSLNASDHSSSRTHHSGGGATKSTSNASSPARSIRNVRDLDDASVYSLLATHRSFVSSAQLLKTLMDVFHDPIRKLPPNSIGAASRVSVQRNIEKILRAWINVFWDDIVLSQDAVREFQKWVNELAHGPRASAGLGQQSTGDGGAVADDGGMYHYASCSLKPLLMTRIGGDAMSRLLSAAGVASSAAMSPAARSPSPNSSTPASSQTPGTASGSSSPTPSILSAVPITPLTPTTNSLDAIPLPLLASHLHLADRYFASALTVPVLDTLARVGYPRTHTHVRIVRDYLAYTTGLFRWVLVSIDAAGSSPKRRVLVLKRMLKLAVQAKDLGALNATCTIVGAIRSPWVVYQAGMWEVLSGKYIRMMRELSEYVDPSDAFGGYRGMVILAGSGVTKIPFIALHLVLAQHSPTADPPSPACSTRWLSLYLPFIKILLEIQSATGATQPSFPPDPVLVSLLSSVPVFSLVRAWAKDIKMGSVADVNAHIAKYRATTAAAATLVNNAGGGSKMFKSLSGSVATLLGSSAQGAGKRAASKSALATVLDASGNRDGPGASSSHAERTSDEQRDGERDAANLFGLGRQSTTSMELGPPQPPPHAMDVSMSGLAGADSSGAKDTAGHVERKDEDPKFEGDVARNKALSSDG